MKLQTLYKKTPTGALQKWTVWTEGSVIVTEWGQVGGALQITRDVIKEGKNLGKKNATTAEEQALLEAQALWVKKQKKGYNFDSEAAIAGETSDVIEGGVFPMLAHRYDQHAAKIKWPALAQPKLDGHRCIAVVKDGQASLWSRTRKPIQSLPHIVRTLEMLITGDAIFDGELYNHDYRENFEELTSFIRQESPKEGHEVVEYHIYDLVAIDSPFQDRFQALNEFFCWVDSTAPLKLVSTDLVEDEDALMASFEAFQKQGYEGAMVRNSNGHYLNRRSYDLQKVKEFVDDDFLVIDVTEGRGKLAGHAIFVCQTKDGQKFAAKMIGELKNLKKYVLKPEQAIGKFLTVKYQGLTKANGVPRFPVATRFKEEL